MSDAPVSPRSICTDMRSMALAIRTRRIALGLSQLEVDHRAGVPDGYTGKLEAILSNPQAKNARAIGWQSLPLILGALKAELVLIPKGSVAVRKPISAAISGKTGGNARARNMSPDERREAARRAVQARWAKRTASPALHGTSKP